MELKPGYKQTEIGVLPEGWEVSTVGGEFSIQLGKMLDADRNVGVSKPYIGNRAVQWDRIDVSELPSVPMTPSDLKRFRLEYGDILVCEGGEVGRAAIWQSLINECYYQKALHRLRPLGGYNRQLMVAVLRRWSDIGFFRNYVTQTSIAHLPRDKFLTVPIPVPPPREQEAIATALSDVDALLEGLDRLIAKKRDLKQAAMQQLLTGKTRLEGFDKEWTLRRLGDHVTFLSHGTNSRAELLPDGPVKYLHYGDIHASTRAMLEPASLPSLPEEKAKGLDRLRDGDLVFADASEDLTGVSKSVEICGVGSTELVAGLHTITARFDKDVLADGFKAYLQFCPVFATQLRRLAAGTKVYATNRSHIASVEMRLPSTDEQSAIAAVFRDMDAEIEALEQRRAKTADLKQAMMQELLTGKTRLVEPQVTDEQAEAASSNAKGHNWAINEAVVIATLVKHFGKEDYPLGRKRYTKLSYLLHRHAERKADGYLKKAAGPYNPQTKYGGPEKIAKKNGYIKQHKGPKGHSGFIAADNIAQAEGYFEKWYGPEVIQWLEQFRFKKNDDLEVLATVDMAAVELRASGKDVDVAAVKGVIAGHPEWEAKLDRPAFSDANIDEAIKQSDALLGPEMVGGSHA